MGRRRVSWRQSRTRTGQCGDGARFKGAQHAVTAGAIDRHTSRRMMDATPRARCVHVLGARPAANRRRTTTASIHQLERDCGNPDRDALQERGLAPLVRPVTLKSIRKTHKSFVRDIKSLNKTETKV